MTKQRNKPAYDVTTGEGQKRLMYESVGLPYVRGRIPLNTSGDYGTDPYSATHVKMVPSGRIVTIEEARQILGPIKRGI